MIYCTHGSSQSDTSTFKPNSEIGICFSPYEYCDLKPQNGFNHKYSDKYVFVIGINTRINITKQLSLITGYNILSLKYKVNYSWQVNPSGDPYLPVFGNIKMKYISFPLYLNFKFILINNFSFYTSTGINYFLLGAISDKTTFANNTTRNSGFATKSLLDYHLGFGFEYKNKRGAKITFEPYYRIFNKGFDNLMHQSPNSLGVKVTIFERIQWKCFFKKGAWKPWPICD